MKNKQLINNYFRRLNNVTPPSTLKARVLDKIAEPAKLLIPQLRVATAFSLCLFLGVFLTFQSPSFTVETYSQFDIEPDSYIESVLLTSSPLSQETVIATLVGFE
jgi:hypothetical protein